MLTTSDQLFHLNQGSSLVNEYTLHFHTLAAASGWNEIALMGAYLKGLNPEIRAAMVLYDNSIGLESFSQRTTRVSQRLAACQLPVSEYAVKTIQGKPLGRGKICHPSPYITLQIGLFHTEEIRFLVLEDSTNSAGTCEVIRWNEQCYDQCLSNLPRPHTVPVHLASTQVESPEPEIPPEIPVEYVAFQDVFSEQAATHLPPHRPWDCAIELLPGAQLPKGQIYPLSILECQAMEEYIAEALKQGFIQPSTSSAALSFFFVGKKDGGLRPCINYCQLNSQIIQQPYPLPLVPAALEELRGAKIFTKLDLQCAYNLVRICARDEWKTPSVVQTFMNEVFRESLHRFVVVYFDDILIYSRNQTKHRQHIQQVLQKLCEHSFYLKLEKCEFHQPSVQFLGYNISAEGVQMDQELQRFLGFSNFYRRFIKAYSSITTPLTSLLRGKPKHLIWNPTAHGAFQRLKTIFSTAPLLHHPDPERPFTVEVDASTIGVEAVLSQAVSESSLLHPCAFFSRKPSPVEQNYNVGNWELLAIKLALEEWRHWLEGATHPFTIITDHKNLQCLHDAKRLNSRQARWALFLTRFNFKITYHSPSEPEPILPSDLIVSPIIWDMDQEIQQTTLQEPAPPECPEGKIYVPHSQRQPLLGAAHQSPGSGHPGNRQTLSLLQTRYWWPSMHRDSGHSRQRYHRLNTLPVHTLSPLMFQLVWDSAHHHPQRAVRRHKRFADVRRRAAPMYQPGDLRLPCRKLSPHYIGPFRIRGRSAMYRIRPTFHVSLLTPFSPSATDTTGAEAEPPPPEVRDLPSTWFTRSWTHGVEGAAWNISLTGRGMVQKNDPGCPERMYSTLRLNSSSKVTWPSFKLLSL
ncbi:hypothetical protein M9458_056998, partial [Cirrhinus mrigala]